MDPRHRRRRQLWTMTALVVVMALLLSLLRVVELFEFVFGADITSPWTELLIHAVFPSVPWILVAPVVAWLAVRHRFRAGSILRSLRWHGIAGFLVAAGVMLLLVFGRGVVQDAAGIVLWMEASTADGEGGDTEVRVETVETRSESVVLYGGRNAEGAEEGEPRSPEFEITSLDLRRPYVAPFLTAFLTYLVFVAIIQGLLFYGELRDREARDERMRAELVRARLQALRSQLRPHFLFNTLNGISALMEEDPATSQRMVNRLADLLRVSFRDGGEEIPLREEVELVRSYLEIEEIRLGDRLRVEWAIEDGLGSVLVPAFCLQPLVENAIRHGIAPLTIPGEVRIVARADGARLHLAVENDGPPRDAEDEEVILGVGLGNVRERVFRLYDDRAVLDAAPRPDGGFRVDIRLPRREATEREERA